MPATPAIQICIDCHDPHRLVRFWADAVGYEVEDHHDGILEIVDAGYATFDETVLIDGRRAWKDAAACRHTDDASRPRLLFQVVPEPKTVKDRIHLDIHTGPGERDATVERLIANGATFLHDERQGPHTWVTLADPEGNEFCVA